MYMFLEKSIRGLGFRDWGFLRFIWRPLSPSCEALVGEGQAVATRHQPHSA